MWGAEISVRTPASVARMSFNGAAPCGARKCPTPCWNAMADLLMLQRGRALWGAEISTCGINSPQNPELQRGRALWGAEMRTTSALLTECLSLQRGRALWGAEIATCKAG